MSLQRLHDGELGVVLEAGRLVPQDLLQDAQGQRSDGVLQHSRGFNTRSRPHHRDTRQDVSCPYVFVSQSLQEEQQHGLEVLVPHHAAVLSGHLQQLQQGPSTLLGAPLPGLALGQLLQQLPHQLQLLSGAGCTEDKGHVRTSQSEGECERGAGTHSPGKLLLWILFSPHSCRRPETQRQRNQALMRHTDRQRQGAQSVSSPSLSCSTASSYRPDLSAAPTLASV